MSTDEEHDFVRVYRTTNVTVLPVVKSILDAAEIPYVVQGGEALAGIYPISMGTGGSSDLPLGAILLVPEDRAEEAKALLESEAPPEASDEEGFDG